MMNIKHKVSLSGFMYDDTMGHVLRLVAKTGPEAAAAASAYSKRSKGDEKVFDDMSKTDSSVNADPPLTDDAALGLEDLGLLQPFDSPDEAGSLIRDDDWRRCEQQYGESLIACILEDCLKSFANPSGVI
jgi:hypothetical protein